MQSEMLSMKLSNDEISVLKACLLFILEHCGESKRDVYSVVKTAYYAQQYSLATWGVPIFRDDIAALPFGPVPSILYNILKMARGDAKELAFYKGTGLTHVADSIGFDMESFYPKERPDMDYLSKTDIESLENAIRRVSKMSFSQIKNDTHGEEWNRVFHGTDPRKIMDIVNIAREGEADEDTIEYLRENLELDNCLRR